MSRRGERLTRQRSALSTLQQNDILSYVPKEITKSSPARRNKKNERCTGPALPETPVTVNKEGLLEIEEIEKIEQITSGTQTEPETIMKTDKCVETPIEMSLDYQMITCTRDQQPIEYWMILAEKRRLALVDRTKEKENLCQEVVKLKERLNDQEKQKHKEEAQYFAFLYRLSSEGLH